MKLFVFFGLPGTGKTYAGEIAEEYFGFHLYDGDTDLTDEMLNAFRNNTIVSDAMRDVFFLRLIESVKKLTAKYDSLVICQTFIKEKYRLQFLKEFPETEFVLIETGTNIREKRLFQRKKMQLDKEYARRMADLFEKPGVSHRTVQNNTDGTELLKLQLQKLLS